MKSMKHDSLRINFQEQFLRIGQISGMFYTVPGRKTRRIVVYGIGAPLPPDDGKLSDATTILNYDTDLYVPDYIGYGRSEGRFTPMNCIRTFLDLYGSLMEGCIAVCNYASLKKELAYDEVHFMGRSFGGTYITLLPRFNKQITNICSIFPIVDWTNIGKSKGEPEETVEGFFQAMTGDGYQHLYRGILDPVWRKHFMGKDDLNPIDNIAYLKNARVFIGHGRKDTNIYYGNSVNYYQKILEMFPDKKDQFLFKLYPYGHSKETSNRAITDYFQSIGLPK